VLSVEPVGMLPGAQRRLYLDALLASQPDPVFAIDEAGLVVIANGAASAACRPGRRQPDRHLDPGPDRQPDLLRDLAAADYHLPACEVAINGEPFLLETMPLHETGGASPARC
jgi:transcriptional regulator of aromatic amino acid metabolism